MVIINQWGIPGHTVTFEKSVNLGINNLDVINLDNIYTPQEIIWASEIHYPSPQAFLCSYIITVVL